MFLFHTHSRLVKIWTSLPAYCMSVATHFLQKVAAPCFFLFFLCWYKWGDSCQFFLIKKNFPKRQHRIKKTKLWLRFPYSVKMKIPTIIR